MPDVLQFDPATHTYTVGGRVVPSVTQVLAPLLDLSKIPRAALEIARQKGVAIHRMVELAAKGELDEDSLPDWLRPVLERWHRFVSDTGFVLAASEQRVYNAQHGYAGTLDLFGAFRKSKALAIVDIKRTFLAGAVTGLQLAGYAAALRTERDKLPFERYALRLNERQNYQLEAFEDKSDYQSFLTALAFHKLKMRIAA